MLRTLKAALGLGLLAALAMSAMSVMSASAITSGHFTSDVATTKLDISEVTGSTHQIKFHAPTLGATVECHHPTYSAHLTNTTAQFITVQPVYANCTNQDAQTVTVTMNGCDYTFTSRTAGHATTHFKCPVGVKAEIHTPNGTFTFGTQTPTGGGATYTTTTENNKHAITANITVTGIHYECHGLCAIFGTTGTNAEMTGAATIKGTDSASGAAVNITAT